MILPKKLQDYIKKNHPNIDNFIQFVAGLPLGLKGQILLLRSKEQKRIVLGSSGIYDKGWIPIEQSIMDIRFPANWEKKFKPNTVDAILAEHVLEHLSEAECEVVLKAAYRVLKMGGYFRIAVPDGNHPSEEYINEVKPGGTGWGSDTHKSLHTYKSLRIIGERIGFKTLLLEYFDDKGEFHFVDWKPENGKIYRSKRFDERNSDGQLRYTSLIIDFVR